MYNQSPLHANPVILNLLFHVYMYVQILNELAVHDVYCIYICMCISSSYIYTKTASTHSAKPQKALSGLIFT